MFELGRKRGPDLAALRELLKVSLTTTTDEEDSISARAQRLAKLGNVVGVAAVRNQRLELQNDLARVYDTLRVDSEKELVDGNARA